MNEVSSVSKCLDSLNMFSQFLNYCNAVTAILKTYDKIFKYTENKFFPKIKFTLN